MASIADVARSDPVGAGIVICAVALAAAGTLMLIEPELFDIRLRDDPHLTAKPGLPEWLRAAGAEDVLAVPGYRVSYWGKPDASYGREATAAKRDPVAIVVHHTAPAPLLNMVRYGHSIDERRGGSYGYHVYIDRDGRIVQGAPLSRRTNHVKPIGHQQRTRMAPHVWNANSIGVTLVGSCRIKPGSAVTERCDGEDVPAPQFAAAVAAISELRRLYGISCHDVYGHGELQRDREPFEGLAVAQAVRRC